MDTDVTAFRLLTLRQRLRKTIEPAARRLMQQQMDHLIADLETARAGTIAAAADRSRDATALHAAALILPGRTRRRP